MFCRRLQPLFLIGCLVLAGCGSDKPRYEVTGTVTFNGAPIETGSISFVPSDPAQPPDAGPIENGRYRVKASPGSKRVQVRASRPLPADRQDPKSEMGLLYEDYIPAQFNTASKLTAEVTAAGPNKFSFDLKP